MSQQQTEKVVLITGANKGIGFETTLQLGEQGITVLVGSRSQQLGEQAAQALQDKGATSTDLHKIVGLQTPEQAAAVIVPFAILPPEGPTGKFFDKNGELPW